MPFNNIGSVVLKNGQEGSLAMITGPEPAWNERICAFLNAPPTPEGSSYRTFLLAQDIPALTSRFFVMLAEDSIAGCIVATDSFSVGYINSTFINRSHRGLGIGSALMSALEEDFSRRGGKVRFLSTRTDSVAQHMFDRFDYKVVAEENGRTYMEKHCEGHNWKDYLSVKTEHLHVEEMSWSHWLPHRVLMWNRPESFYRPLASDFITRIRDVVTSGAKWKVLAAPDGRVFGDALLRPHDQWTAPAIQDSNRYVLDLYVHPGYEPQTQRIFDAVMPDSGQVQAFLSSSSKHLIDFLSGQGFSLETSLKDDFNHHNPDAVDIRVYTKDI